MVVVEENFPRSKGVPTLLVAPMFLAAGRFSSNHYPSGMKNKNRQGSAGGLLVILFLSKFVFPLDGSFAITDIIMNYYGVLLGYGSLQELFQVQSPEHVVLLLHFILPSKKNMLMLLSHEEEIATL